MLILVAVVSVSTTSVLWVELLESDQIMKRSHSCAWGIVSLELAFSASSARRILDGWGEAGIEAARASLDLDTWFIIAYVAAIASVSFLGVVLGHGWIARAGPWAAGLAVLAGALDLVENRALALVIEQHAGGGDRLPMVAGLVASVKLAAVGPAAVFAVVTMVILLRRGLSRP